MWRLLYPFRTDGFHFRKQSAIGPFVADFACHHARVVIELDGWTHGTEDELRRDGRRDEFLRGEGYTVMRFSNGEVLENPEGVFVAISEALRDRPRSRRGGDG